MIFYYVFSLIICTYLRSCDAANTQLTDKNWRDMLEGEWMVKFYAPWCPACRAVANTWKEFGIWAEEKSVKVGSVDVTAEGALNGRFMVTSLPTIYHVRDGEFRKYASSRTLTDFQDFITKQQWRSIQPMSSWVGPDSFAMGTISKVFSFSMQLKTFHESLRNEYGLPGWAAMLLFGLIVVIVGLALGVGLIFFFDWYFGPEDYPSQLEQQLEQDAISKEKTKVVTDDKEEDVADNKPDIEDDKPDIEDDKQDIDDKKQDIDDKKQDADVDQQVPTVDEQVADNDTQDADNNQHVPKNDQQSENDVVEKNLPSDQNEKESEEEDSTLRKRNVKPKEN